MSLQGDVKLDEAFFWGHLVPLLTQEDQGLTSASIHDKLSKRGLKISKEGLRVFLHRNKVRERLTMNENNGGPARWNVSSDVYATASRLMSKDR